MLAIVRTAAVYGIEASQVQVEVDVSFGLPQFTMVGLPDASVRESRDRVRSAIRNSGFEFPPHRVTVNLAPADVRKAGTSFDLPIALGVLAASGLVTRRQVDDTLLVGELSLDGAIQPARGVLPIAAAARRDGVAGLLLPARQRRRGGRRLGPAALPGADAARGGRGHQRPAAAGRRAGPARGRRGRGRRTWPTCAARRSRGGRSRWRRPAATTS